MSLAGLCAAGLAVQRRPGSTPGWAYDPTWSAPNDALALLLFMLVVPLFSFFIAPLMAQLSRKHEFEADAYAVAQTSGTRPGHAHCSSSTKTTPRRSRPTRCT